MFRKIFTQVLSTLGLLEKAKAKTLTKEDWDKITQSYKEATGRDFYADAKAEDDKIKLAHDAALEIISKAEKDDDDDEGKSSEDTDDDDDEGKGSEDTDDDDDEKGKKKSILTKKVQSIVNDKSKLKAENKKLKEKAAVDKPADVFDRSIAIIGGAHTDKHIFGIEHAMFLRSKRWNQLTVIGRKHNVDPDIEDGKEFQKEAREYAKSVGRRISQLHNLGLLSVDGMKAIDYSQLTNANLGEQFVVFRQDALIARIIEIPSVKSIFSMRSNIQDQDLITNAFFGEFSQAYQEGEISKGGAELQPEMGKVHDVMFKFLFKSMKWMETQYIGYLNTNGSDPVKWNMIEWYILQIAKVLINEQNKRYMKGNRLDPITGVTAPYLTGATGVFWRIQSYIENYQVLPFTDPLYQTYTQSTILDVLEAFMEDLNQKLESLEGLILYVNSKHEPWWKIAYREQYGKDIDFREVKFVSTNYNVPIVFVPCMDNSTFFFATYEGNMQLLENVPGEMFGIYFERRLESVWAMSVWKEGSSAAHAGKKFRNVADIAADNYKHSMIFCNMPTLAFAADDATPSVSGGNIFKTSADNTAAVNITTLKDTSAGETYKIIYGGGANATTINKTGDFEKISEDWAPTTEGAWIKLVKIDDKFYEAERSV